MQGLEGQHLGCCAGDQCHRTEGSCSVGSLCPKQQQEPGGTVSSQVAWKGACTHPGGPRATEDAEAWE